MLLPSPTKRQQKALPLLLNVHLVRNPNIQRYRMMIAMYGLKNWTLFGCAEWRWVRLWQWVLVGTVSLVAGPALHLQREICSCRSVPLFLMLVMICFARVVRYTLI